MNVEKVFDVIFKVVKTIKKVFFPGKKKHKKKKKHGEEDPDEDPSSDPYLEPPSPPPIPLLVMERRNRSNAHGPGSITYSAIAGASTTLTGYMLIAIGLSGWLLKILS